MTIQTVKHTLLVIDQRYRVHSWAVNADWAQREADRLAEPGNGTYSVIDLASTDVATLARIAAADCEALTRRGSGFLGAGTHPAQPYLEVMLQMRGVTTEAVPGMTFGHDRVADCINAFLGNASTWRGDTARAVKAALKAMAAKR
jgi:hypothetical protein